MEKKSNIIAATHTGPLSHDLAIVPWKLVSAHLMKKIHRHVVRSAMIPPSNGPNRLDIVKTELITPE